MVSNVWRALWRAKLLILLAAIVGAVLAYLYAQGLERRYTAVTQVMIDTRVQQDRSFPIAEAVLPTTTTAVESELELLRSYDLVERVVTVLELDSDPEFAGGEDAEEDGGLRNTLAEAWGELRDSLGLTEEAPAQSTASADGHDEERLIASVARRRSVDLANSLSAVYSIAFTSRDPVKAARVANTFAEQYLGLQIAAKQENLERAHNWLAARASDLNRQLVQLSQQREAHALRAPFSSEESLQDAQSLRDNVTRRLEAAQNRGGGGGSDLSETLEWLNRRLADQAAHEAETLRLENEVEVTEAVYSRVVEQLSDLQEQGDVLRPDAQIIARARPPLDPSEPKTRLLTATGGAAGILLLTGLVTLREVSQRRLRTWQDYEEATNLPILGFMPRTRQWATPLKTVLVGRAPDARLVKAVRKLRASLGASDSPHQVIAGASSLPGEGKSSTVLMLAHSYAQKGERTLVLDYDFWRSPFRTYDRSGRKALKELVSNPELLAQQVVDLPGLPLSILPAGREADYDANLHESQSFKEFMALLRSRYDRILIDLPPVLPVIDVAPLAAAADVTVFMVQWNATPRSAVQTALRVLRDVGVVPVGVVATLVRGEKAHSYADDAFSYAHRRYSSGY